MSLIKGASYLKLEVTYLYNKLYLSNLVESFLLELHYWLVSLEESYFWTFLVLKLAFFLPLTHEMDDLVLVIYHPLGFSGQFHEFEGDNAALVFIAQGNT